MRGVLYSKTVAVHIIEHVSSQMKKKPFNQNLESSTKLNVLANESIRVGDKSTLIVFLRASVDSKRLLLTFR